MDTTDGTSASGGGGGRATGVLPREVARFDALAATWWDPRGPMRELHRMNPLRIGWIQSRVARHAGPGRALRILDVGCGAGIAAEALARHGHTVLGIDAAAAPIAAARTHAAAAGLAIDYRVASLEDLAAEPARFDVITALEVIEHVAEPAAFLRSAAAILAPGGLVFVSTLNRTARSFALAIVGAEYLAGLLPRGTHDWRRFLTPAELAAASRRAGLRLGDVAGMRRDPLLGTWRETRDTAVNYIAMAEGIARPAAA